MRARHPILALAAAILLALGSPPKPLDAEDGARALVLKMIARTTADDEQSILTWKIIAPDGAEKVRRLSVRQKRGDGGKQMLLIRLLAPPELRRTALLGVSGGDKPDAQWIYLPHERRVKRIGDSEGAERFLGSDFACCDLEAENPAANVYRLLAREDVGGDPCDVVEATPAAGLAGAPPYAKRRLWIRAEDSFPVKTELFEEGGSLLKTLSVLELVAAGGFTRADRLEMRNEREGSRTLVTVESRRINAGLSERLFSERELEEGD